ncbi:MAG: zf-HC2 domain-containing protein [Polaromonas sp.]|nr:zf-HC2 domain-containing protein [Polaromonas sp.]
MKPTYPLKLTCKDAAALMLAREDRALPLSERAALRLHLAICACCPRFERQLLTMRNAMAQWRAYVDTDDKDER